MGSGQWTFEAKNGVIRVRGYPRFYSTYPMNPMTWLYRLGIQFSESKIQVVCFGWKQRLSRTFVSSKFCKNEPGMKMIFFGKHVQAPAHVLETVVDSRRILDLQLRDSCQIFINDSGNVVILELADFFKKVRITSQFCK